MTWWASDVPSTPIYNSGAGVERHFAGSMPWMTRTSPADVFEEGRRRRIDRSAMLSGRAERKQGRLRKRARG